MSPALLSVLLSQLGTVGLPLIAKLMADFEAKRTQTTVTEADLLELARLQALTSDSIYARLGITPPPPSVPPSPAVT